MKKSVFALASLLATSATFAADYTWTDGGTYTLGAEDTLTIDASAGTVTITSGSVTGSGTVNIDGGKVVLNYNLNDYNVFGSFTGTLAIKEGAALECNNPKGSQAEIQDSPINKEATIRFEGGRLTGFTQGNNISAFPTIEIPQGKSGLIENLWANYLSGVNLSLSRPLRGSGTLTVDSDERWVALSGDNSGFSGKFVFNKVKPDHTQGSPAIKVNAAKSGSAAAEWVFNPGNFPVELYHTTSSTLDLGALSVTNASRIYIDHSSTTVKIGAAAGTNSVVNVPFTNKAFTLNKVGADTTLTLGSAVTFIDGTTLDIDEGVLKLDGCDISGVTTDFASGTTLRVTANGGTVAVGSSFGNVDLTDGTLTFAAGNWADGATPTLFTYSGTLTGFTTDKITITGLGGNATAVVSDDGSGTVTAMVSRPTLEWNGTGTDWADANAWTSGGNNYTFADGDMVAIPANATIALSSTVKPASVTISGAATLSGEGTVECASIANAATLTVSGDVTFTTVPTGGTINVTGALTTTGTSTITSATAITGAGSVVFDGATVTLDHSLLNASVPFRDFTGMVVMTNAASVTQTGRSYSYPSDNDGDIQGPFGDSAKIVFAGGILSGFRMANNVYIHNDMEIVEGTENTIDCVNASEANKSPNEYSFPSLAH